MTEITISRSIKNQETTEVLTGITIHKKSSIGDGSKTVIKAKDGKLQRVPSCKLV
jgi:hypothetical protein